MSLFLEEFPLLSRFKIVYSAEHAAAAEASQLFWPHFTFERPFFRDVWCGKTNQQMIHSAMTQNYVAIQIETALIDWFENPYVNEFN